MDLRHKTPDELTGMLSNLKKEQFNLRFQKASGQLEKTDRVRVVRRDIARIRTLMAEAAAKTTNGKEAPAKAAKPAPKKAAKKVEKAAPKKAAAKKIAAKKVAPKKIAKAAPKKAAVAKDKKPAKKTAKKAPAAKK